MNRNSRLCSLLFGAALGLPAFQCAYADDTEIFNVSNVNVPANILLILDTSGSMNTIVEDSTASYDVATSYPGSCDPNTYAYFVLGSAARSVVPDCSSASQRVPLTALKCQAAVNSFAAGTLSYYAGNFIRWGQNSGSVGSSYRWRDSLTDILNGGDVECEGDAGVHGNGVDLSRLYPDGASSGSSSDTSSNWVNNSGDSYWDGEDGTAYRFYSGNYLNYLAANEVTSTTRAAILKDSLTSLLQTGLTGVNVGLMRYDTSGGTVANGDGGMVTNALAPIATSRDALIDTIDSWRFAGNTPMSETLAEAYRYFSGSAVVAGNSAHECSTNALGQCSTAATVASNSVAAARTGGAGGANYDSPADYSCQKNFLVFLTDGQPTADNNADSFISSLPDFASQTGGCESWSGHWSSFFGSDNSGRCLAALSEYMYERDLRSDVTNVQNVKSYFIGFGDAFYPTDEDPNSNEAKAWALLQDAATRGGGEAYQASDEASLSAVFQDIASETALEVDTLFSAPTVAVNAFNRTQTLDDLYVSVFMPQATFRWFGNVKKYRVVTDPETGEGSVVDANGNEAVDPSTGFFKPSAHSHWSGAADGSTVAAGGAAHKLPTAANISARKVYTLLGTNAYAGLRAPAEIQDAITASNQALHLDIPGGGPSYTDLISWARGIDVQGLNPDTNTTGVRRSYGDPVHSEPAVVVYGKGNNATDDDDDEVAVFVSTNDGYLHAIDATADVDGRDLSTSGTELWSFIPQELLPDLYYLYKNDLTTTKHYGLDGSIRVLKYDQDGDGVIETSGAIDADDDRVILYFTTGRNSSVSRYYALDVTIKDQPKFLWSLAPAELPGLGQTWSTPTIAKVNVGGATQNGQKLVLIFGGGYDPDEDSYSFNPSNSVGNKLFMIDAASGALLWSAGAAGANLNVSRMTHSIPAAVSVIDIDSDGYADRMYVGDMAAQLWRFDIFNGATVSNLVAGGVLASFGAKELLAPTMASTRRFYATPDVALIEPVGGSSFLNIAIGSGYRGHPLNTETSERLYAFRDYQTFLPMGVNASAAQAAYDGLTLVEDDDMTDISTNLNSAIGAHGWKLLLPNSGEKVLAPARTLDNKVFFTTYSPGAAAPDPGDPCIASSTGSNRLYAMSVFNGNPVRDRTGDGEIDDIADRSEDLGQGGIAPGVSLLFPGGEASRDNVLVMSGPEIVDTCQGCRALRKTYWRESAAL